MSGKLFILGILVLAACCFLQASAHPALPDAKPATSAFKKTTLGATVAASVLQKGFAQAEKAASNAPKPADVAGAVLSAVPDAKTATDAVKKATEPVAKAASNAPKPADVAGAVQSAVPDANAKDTVKDVTSAVSRR